MKLYKGQKVYYVRRIVDAEHYDIYECTVRTIEDTQLIILDKHTKQAFVVSKKNENKTWFFNRGKALETALRQDAVIDALE